MNKTIAQILTCIVAQLTAFTAGITLGWATPMIPRLIDSDFEDSLTTDQVASMLSIGGVVSVAGPILTYVVTDHIGRKYTLCLSLVPAIIGYAIISQVMTFTWLCVGRSMACLSAGIFLSTIPMYIGEIVEGRIRGAMNVMAGVFSNTGCLYCYILAPMLTPKMFALASGIPAIVIMVLILVLLPETPYQHLMRGNIDGAYRSLKWLRGNQDVTEELKNMEKYVAERKHRKTGIMQLVEHGTRKAMVVCSLLLLIVQSTGFLPIQMYAALIFQQAGFIIEPDTSVIIFGAILLVTNNFSMFVVDRLGRRTLLASSCIAICLFLAIIGTFYKLQASGYDVSSLSWIPLITVIAHAIVTNLGLLSLPFIVSSEVFPTNIKAAASSILAIEAACLNALFIKGFQLLMDDYGIQYAFFLFLVLTITFLLITLCIMPETMGKTFQENEDLFNERRLTPQVNAK